jgi:hypothetical protein
MVYLKIQSSEMSLQAYGRVTTSEILLPEFGCLGNYSLEKLDISMPTGIAKECRVERRMFF